MIAINSTDLQFILSTTPHDQNIMLVGKHGIGKSEIITHFYENKEMRVVPLFLGQMSDPGDIIGLPFKHQDGRTHFSLPYWFPTDGAPIVLFLDELNRARPEILQVVQDLVLNKTIAGNSLPKGSVIVSAINYGEEYTLTDIDPALLSRFNVYYFEPSVAEWIMWACSNKLSDSVIDFISSNESMLDFKYNAGTDTTTKSADRRAWKRVSDYVKNIDLGSLRHNKASVMLSFKKAICGIVGDVAGMAYCKSIEENSIVSPEMIINDFEHAVSYLIKYDVIQMTTISIRVCSYIDSLDPRSMSAEGRKSIADGLIRYIKFLNGDDEKNKSKTSENAKFFVSEYETGAYPKLSAFVNSDTELMNCVYRLIEECEY